MLLPHWVVIFLKSLLSEFENYRNLSEYYLSFLSVICSLWVICEKYEKPYDNIQWQIICMWVALRALHAMSLENQRGFLETFHKIQIEPRLLCTCIADHSVLSITFTLLAFDEYLIPQCTKMSFPTPSEHVLIFQCRILLNLHFRSTFSVVWDDRFLWIIQRSCPFAFI